MKSGIVVISIGFLFPLVPCFSALYYEGGSGAPDNPYRIRTVQQFNTIGLHPEHWRKHFTLMEDLDLLALADEPFHPIGTDEWNQRFSGVFDGNGHTLSNFRFAAENSDPVGLFVTVTGTIRNLTLIGVNVHNGIGNRTGSLAGRLHFGHLVNCHVQGEIVSGRRAVGGLIGENHGGVVTHCSAACQVAGEQDVGGLVGDTQGGIVHNSFASGPVMAAGDHSGGLAGQNYSSLIQNCYAIGDVEGNDFCGGLVGRNFSGSVVNCYAMGAVAGRMEIGGLVGRNLEKGAIVTSFSA
ncbi:MAG: hypothetical protein JW828_10280, partial [Sedimentisphaerales bacterium]|nr:hypothetical protein [Sedimentisphaerales bacterium]